MKVGSTAMIVALMLLAGACSSGESESQEAQAEPESSETTVQAVADASSDDAEAEDAAPAEDADDNTFAEAAAGGAEATVALENGETYTFNILCALEPQESAGQEILFTVVSYDDPVNLGVTQSGADSFGGVASVSLYDSTTYDTVWDANTLHGSELVLELNGNTVTGHGIFLAGEDGEGPGVPGVLEANC
jgi:hypothetical protein